MLAVGSCVAGTAQAAERVHAVHAGPAIETGAGAAVGQVLFAVEASVARWAGAGKGSHVVGAGARAAGVAQALVHVAGASWAGETKEAGAGKGAHAVLARATVQAWVGVTVIDVLIAGRASVPSMAGAAETPCQVGADTMRATGCGASTLVHILLASWALPALGAGADRQLARGRLAAAPMLTGVRGAGGEELTLTSLDTRGAGAVETHPIAAARPAGPAGLRLTGISSQALAAAGATPAGLTHTAEPARCIIADAVTAGLMGTGMARGEAEWGQGAGRAEAAEAVFPIHAGTSLAARAGSTLIDLHVTKGPCEARLADTVVAVDTITADSKAARVAGTVVNVHFAVHTCSPRRAAAEVLVHQV